MESSGYHYRPSTGRTPCGAALVLRDGLVGKVFMLKRTGAHGEGTWSFPGGWIEPGEEPSRAACREAWEEVGVNVLDEHVEFLGYTADKHPEGLYGITLWFETDKWIGNPRNVHPSRVAETGWFDPALGMPGPLFVPVQNGMKKGLI